MIEPEHVNLLTDEGIILDDGSRLAWPECDGTVRRYDEFGRLMEERGPGEEGQDEWLALFPVDVVEVEFTATFRRTLRCLAGVISSLLNCRMLLRQRMPVSNGSARSSCCG